jgi:hypothetical protein
MGGLGQLKFVGKRCCHRAINRAQWSCSRRGENAGERPAAAFLEGASGSYPIRPRFASNTAASTPDCCRRICPNTKPHLGQGAPIKPRPWVRLAPQCDIGMTNHRVRRNIIARADPR